MNNNEYLNENKYQQTNVKVNKAGKILLITGLVVLIVGIFLVIFGMMGMGNSVIGGMNTSGLNNFNNSMIQNSANKAFGSFGLVALGGFMSTIGFGITIAGGIMLLLGHKREITAYTVQQTMPIAQEGIEKMAPTIGKAAGTIAKGIREGLKDSEK